MLRCQSKVSPRKCVCVMKVSGGIVKFSTPIRNSKSMELSELSSLRERDESDEGKFSDKQEKSMELSERRL